MAEPDALAGWRQWLNARMEAPPTAQPAPTGLTPAPPDAQPVNVGFHSLQPGFDVIELLPERCADRLRQLRQRSADCHAIIPPFEEIRLANAAKVEAANALQRLQAHPSEGGFNLPDDNRSVIESRRTLDKMTDAARRLTELQTVRTAQWQSASQALAGCEDYLRHGVPGNCQIVEAVEVEPPKLLKGEDVLSALERTRRHVRELKSDLARIAAAPFHSSHARAKIKQEVEALASRGEPVVGDIIEHDRSGVIWPMMRQQSEVIGAERRALAFAEVPDTLALFAWLHRDALLARLDALVDAEQDDAAALTYEQRQQRTAETMGDLLATERDECALTWLAQSQGLPVEFRSDVSPVALLGLKLITVAPTNGDASASSPERASYSLLGGRR